MTFFDRGQLRLYHATRVQKNKVSILLKNQFLKSWSQVLSTSLFHQAGHGDIKILKV